MLVTVSDQKLVDRRRVELIDEGLPSFPHHHEGQRLPLQKAIALVERVRASAEKCTRACLEALANEVSPEIVGMALRKFQPLPETVAERITNYQAQARADSVMYRDVLARAAETRGWFVDLYDAKAVLTGATLDLVERAGKSAGRPWQKDHRTAMAAALIAAARER